MAMCMLCRKCSHRWVAVAPVPSESPTECPQCGEYAGIQQPELTEQTKKSIGLMKGNSILIESLMGMVNQHFDTLPGGLCHSFMSADKGAIDTLLDAGFAEMVSERPLRYRLLWDKLAERIKALDNGEA